MPYLKNEAHTEALEKYIQAGQKDFYRLALSYTKNSEAAMDVVQEAIVKAITNVEHLKNEDSMKSWFYRILVNEALTYLRKNKKIVLDESYYETLTYEDKDTSESIDLYHAIEKLEPKLKTVVLLRFFEDMKLDQIAVVTNTNLSTVKSRLYKALELLKTWIDEE